MCECVCFIFESGVYGGIYFTDMFSRHEKAGESGVEWSIAFNQCHWLIVQFLLNMSVQTTRQTNSKSYFNITNTCPCNIQRFVFTCKN